MGAHGLNASACLIVPPFSKYAVMPVVCVAADAIRLNARSRRAPLDHLKTSTHVIRFDISKPAGGRAEYGYLRSSAILAAVT
jgi:hypothetical protein